MLREADILIIPLLRGCPERCDSACVTSPLPAGAELTCVDIFGWGGSLLKVVEEPEERLPSN